MRSFAVDTPSVHDPVMAFENGTYHLYSTGNGLSHYTSHDMKHWTGCRQGAITDIPQWTHDSVPGFTQHVWAPDIIQFNGRWYLSYACSSFGKNTSAIGLLSKSSLNSDEPWHDEGCILASRGGRDNWNAIDPNVIVAQDGTPWLAFGSFWDGIQLVRLDSSLHVAPGERPFTIARRYAPTHPNVADNPTSDEAGPFHLFSSRLVLSFCELGLLLPRHEKHISHCCGTESADYGALSRQSRVRYAERWR